MKLKNGFVMREVCGEHVLVGEGVSTVDFSSLVRFNDTAAFIWKKAEDLGDFTESQIAEALVEEYDIDIDTALKDVKELLAEWQKKALLC
jgi:hypothetical protein